MSGVRISPPRPVFTLLGRSARVSAARLERDARQAKALEHKTKLAVNKTVKVAAPCRARAWPSCRGNRRPFLREQTAVRLRAGRMSKLALVRAVLFNCAGVAQLVEQRTCNAKVEGSNPFTGTTIGA